MRSYPQPEFSLAKRTMSASTSGSDGGPPRRDALFGAVEFAGNEAAVPGENRIGFRDASCLLEGSATEPLANLSECGSLGIGKAHTDREARSQDAVFGGEVFVLEQQSLVHEAGDIGQQARPFVFLHC